jgi:valyl-tRNA synthetase
MDPMEKAFAPAEVEPRWRKRWEELGVGIADVTSDKPAFTIALPPPNITAELHLGHAAQQSVQDSLARYHRMRGFEVEWAPGTDHAALATNAVIERQLALQGLTKEQIGREAFQELVDDWYRKTGGRILEQMRELGFSCDWSRLRFTLDEPYVRAIRTVFKALYDEGLVYRGPRIVNWCPHDRSAISDEEVRWEEHTDTLVRIVYPVEEGRTVTVATVRPETMLGDTGVAVAPGDPRYADLVGKHVILPLTGRRVPIVADEAVQPEFGTGALKVTPGHDPTDYEIGHRHGLPVITVIAPDGTMDVPHLPRFHGIPAEVARDLVTQALREQGAVAGEEPYVHEVGHCDRCGSVLEPLVSEQWWVRMRPLAEPAIAAVERGDIRFHPQKPHTDVYLTWMRNIRDWCISRQIWLGHRVPVSTCANGHRFAWVEHPDVCPECGSNELTDDTDVLDTWFSSALWPFAIFGWPEQTPDLKRFYPTQVLVTARDIIFLWVARMIMTGIKFTGAVPFSDVIINSTIQAADGSRMSKSRGNGVDPVEMIDRYGADAVRAWSGAVGTAGQDMRFDENRIASYRLFANKLWNVTRLLVMRTGGEGNVARADPQPDPSALRVEDRWVLTRVAATVDAVTLAIEQYRFQDAMERIYDTAWHLYCDDYVEIVKDRLGDPADPAAWVAAAALDTLLRLLHPFMPFVTEETAQRLPNGAATLQQREWPQPPAWWRAGDLDGAAAVDGALELVARVRQARQEAGIPPHERPGLTIDSPGPLGAAELGRLLAPLARVNVLAAPPEGARALSALAAGLEARLWVGEARAEADAARLRKQRGELATQIEQLRGKLANPGFVEKAPAPLVEDSRGKLAEAEAQLARLDRVLDDTDQ